MRVLYTSEVWNNQFKWMKVNLNGGPKSGYFEYNLVHGLSSFSPYIYATRQTSTKVVLTDLFKSDEVNSNFTLILENLVIEPSGRNPSFQELPALEGLYLANVYDKEYTNAGITSAKFKNVVGEDKKNYIKTMISFDYGNTWNQIKVPNKDSVNKTYDWKGCHLHFHLGNSAAFAPVYGVESAPGLLIGVGNVGQFLDHMTSKACTFISEDGGLNWREVSKHPSMYEIGDQGGIIVRTEYGTATNKVFYTYDYGRTWFYNQFLTSNNHNISDLFVSNVIMEPSNNFHKFLITGNTDSNEKTYVVTLDFSEFQTRLCKGHELANISSADTDYEKFVPHTYSEGK